MQPAVFLNICISFNEIMVAQYGRIMGVQNFDVKKNFTIKLSVFKSRLFPDKSA